MLVNQSPNTRPPALPVPEIPGELRPDFSYPIVAPRPGPLSPEDRLVFVHLEKTGGTSLHKILCSHFAPSQICPINGADIMYYTRDDLVDFRFFAMHAPIRQFRHIPGPRKFVTFLRDPSDRLISLYRFWASHTDYAIQLMNSRLLFYVKRHSLLDLLAPERLSALPDFWNVYAHRLGGDLFVSPQGRPWRDMSELLDSALETVENLTTFGISEYPELSFALVAEDLGIENRYDGLRLNATDDNVNSHPDIYEPIPGTTDAETRAAIWGATRLDRIIYESGIRNFYLRLEKGVRLRCIAETEARSDPRFGCNVVIATGQSGFTLYGPYLTLPPGRYVVTFRYRRLDSGNAPAQILFDVCSDIGSTIHAASFITVPPLESEDFIEVDVPFSLSSRLEQVEFRTSASGDAPLLVSREVKLRRT